MVRDGKYRRRIKGRDIVRKDVAKFNDIFYATFEMFKGASIIIKC